MLSADGLIDPPSSSLNQIKAKSDGIRSSAERIGSQQLDTIDFVASTPTPNFSIRDYVCKSRSNKIGACWPFKPKFLQLCLKSGVKELLPPFEPPNLIKNCPISVVPQPDSAVTDALREKRELSSGKDIDKVTKNLQSVVIKDKKKRKQGIRKVKGPGELPESKCKLVVKLNSSVPVTSRAEELASNNSAAIDQMSSKICPVCKTFSSSSNTTLNAHIDQCLSNDSGAKQFESDVLKPRIKPRKKKLMVEIYSTALEYTLEDLDRRNGTNWAATAVVVDPSELSVKPMKPKEHENTRKLVVESRGKDREGAVYVDSNGIKIRILSEPNDVPSSSVVVSRDDKKGKVRFGKQKGIETRNMEKKKLVLERKKLKKFKISKTQLTTDENGTRKVNEDEMEGASTHLDRLLEKSKDPIIWKSTASPLGKWVCARRGIRMKRKNKSPDKIIQCLASILEDSPSTSSQVTKYSNSKFAHSTLQPKMPKPLVGIGGESLSENVSTSIRFSSGPSAGPRSTPSLSRKFQKQQSILKSAKKGRRAPCSYGVFGESTEVFARENIHGNKRLKLTPDDELHEVFSPELEEETQENTEVRDGTSPVDDTELDVEAPTSNHHFIEHVNSPNDEPINLGNVSWFQEEYVGAVTSDYDDDNNDALDDEDDNEGNNDVNVGDGADDVEGVEDDFAVESSDETSCDTPQDDSSLTSDGEDEMNLERSLANFQEQSGSPSTASTMSFSALNEHCHKEPGSYAQPPCPDLVVPQAAERPKGEEIMDKPCVCSCRESPSEESKKAPIVTKEKQLPPLYIGPRETGPFNAYRGFSRPDPIVSSGFESPSQSFSTLSQGLVPPSPNPVLRLMGKNLLVVNHEEVATTQPPTPSSHCPPAFKPPNCGADPNYPHQNFSSVLTQSQPAANLYQPFLVSERQRPVSPSSYVPSEVIVLDNPPKIDNMLVPLPVPMQLQGASIVGPGNPVPQNIAILGAPVMQPSPFFCFPQHNQAGSTGPVLYPRVGPGYITQQVAPPGSHEIGSYVQGSFAYRPSSSHVSNPLYYTHTMR